MAKTHAIRIEENGGPELLNWEEIALDPPGPGEVLVKNAAVGLNFMDVYQRKGLYKVNLPFTMGSEGAGVIESVGPKVKGFKVGDRVAYVSPSGAYAERLVRPADRLVKVPAGVSDEVAAASVLKGLTAEYLLRRTYKVKRGDTILVHAAAGGVGQILCQWARHLGAVIIGTVGDETKAALAKKCGCRHVINSRTENVAERVKAITKGRGVPVVYDGVGKDTFEASLDALAPRGLLVFFGASSGPVPPFDLSKLAGKGSLYITRPTLNTYAASPEELKAGAQALFGLIKKGVIKVSIGQRFPLREARRAHEALEARQTTGSTLLLP